jgi:hypothetical protein
MIKMKWFTLYNKIGDLKFKQMQQTDVKAIIDGKEIILKAKFDSNGLPYLEEDKKGEKKL